MIINDPDFLTWADLERVGIALFRPDKDAMIEFGNWCDSICCLGTDERHQALNLFLRGWQIASLNWNDVKGEVSIFSPRSAKYKSSLDKQKTLEVGTQLILPTRE